MVPVSVVGMDHLAPPPGADGAVDAPPAAVTSAVAVGVREPDGWEPVPDVPERIVGDTGDAWESLTSAVTTLGGAPVWQMGDEALAERVRDLETVRARLDAYQLTVLRELDDRGWAARVGAVSTASWLAQAVRVDPRTAAGEVRAARALDPAGDAPPEPGAPVMTGAARSDDGPVLAATGRALAAGAVSRAHAEAVLAGVRALPRHPDPDIRADLTGRAEDFLLTQCGLFDPATVRRLAREVVHALDPTETLAQELAAAARDELWLTTTATGRVRIRGEVDQVTGALLTTLIDAGSAPQATRPGHDDPESTSAGTGTGTGTGDDNTLPVPSPAGGGGNGFGGTGGQRDTRSPATRRAHALAEVLRVAANASPRVCGGLNPHLLITMTLDTLRTHPDTDAAESAAESGAESGAAPTTTGSGMRPGAQPQEPGRRGRGRRTRRMAVTETGVPISAGWARVLACDATIIPLVLGADSEPLDIGRATRLIPPPLRRALVARDKGCAFPGCRRPPRWTDAHHIRHWADGGPTALTNLVLLCRRHHDAIHHGGWTVTITDARPTFTPPAWLDPHQRPRAPTDPTAA